MNFGAVISRALKISWQYKVLWALMLIPGVISLIGSLLGLGNTAAFQNLNANAANLRSMDELFALYTRLFALLLPVLLLQTVIGLIAGVAALITRAGIIAGVQQAENGAAPGLGGTLTVGFHNFWKFLVVSILLGLPLLLLIVIVFAIVGVPILPLIQAFTAGANPSDDEMRAVFSGVLAAMCVAAAVGCVGLIYALIAAAIQTLGERAMVIEGIGPLAGIARGWQLLRSNLGNVVLLAVVLFIISIVISFGLGMIGNAFTLPAMNIMMQEIANGVQPSVSTMLSSPSLVILTIISAVIELALQLFAAVAWTLAYRAFTGAALPSATVPPYQPPLPAA